MECPPETIRNPITGRCVKMYGRLGKQLLGYQQPTYQQAYRQPVFQQPAYQQAYRQPVYQQAYQQPVYRQAYQQPVYRQAYQQQAYRQPVGIGAGLLQFFDKQPQYQYASPVRQPSEQPCPPNMERNPATGRCIKIGAKTYRKLHPPTPKVQTKPPTPKRISSSPRIRLPVGTASVAPQGDKHLSQSWLSGCNNSADPITNKSFDDMSLAELQRLIRLHTGTCIIADELEDSVHQQHRIGAVATIPGIHPPTHLTLDDFNALRKSMRYINPKYKLPGRTRQPPPRYWRLYASRDERSGPDYMSILIVDTTKVRTGANGKFVYPPECVMIDLGFIPVKIPADAACDLKTLVKLLKRLEDTNRLLNPVPGGWKPVAGFPFSKSHWATDRTERINRLCKKLTYELDVPL